MCSSSITSDTWPGLTEEAEKLIAAVQAVIHEGRSNERFASVTPNEEVLSDYSKLERIAELEAKVEGVTKKMGDIENTNSARLRTIRTLKNMEKELVVEIEKKQSKIERIDDDHRLYVNYLESCLKCKEEAKQAIAVRDQRIVVIESQVLRVEDGKSAQDSWKKDVSALQTKLWDAKAAVKTRDASLQARADEIKSLRGEMKIAARAYVTALQEKAAQTRPLYKEMGATTTAHAAALKDKTAKLESLQGRMDASAEGHATAMQHTIAIQENSGKIQALQGDLKTELGKVTTLQNVVESLHTKIQELRNDMSAAAEQHAKKLQDKAGEVSLLEDKKAKDMEKRLSIKNRDQKSLEAKMIEADNWSSDAKDSELGQATKALADIKTVAEQRATRIDELSQQPTETAARAKRGAQSLRDKATMAEELAKELYGKIDEVTGLLKQKTAEADSLVEQLRAKNRLQTTTQLLQQKTTQADELSMDLKAKTEDFESAVRDEVKSLSSHLSERDGIITKLPDELLGKDAVVETKSAQVESLYETVPAIFNSMTSKHLDIVQWLEIWDTLEEHPIECEPVNIPIWTFDQSLAANIYNLGVRGISTVCMYLIATLRAGKWDNEAMCLMNR
ncbi:hypothetical protein P885DRAFT_65074 [Corynascus similis CBS 632.67]